MAGILRNFQPALKNVFLKIKKTCTVLLLFTQPMLYGIGQSYLTARAGD